MSAATTMSSAAAIAVIEAARRPRDIFPDADAEAHRTYRRLARLVHPDAAGEDARAASAFRKLSALWQRHRSAISSAAISSAAGGVLAAGDIANLIAVPATGPGEPAVLKLARDPADGDLIAREAAALRWLAKNGDPEFLPYIPRLLETRRYTDPATGGTRRGNVLEHLSDFISLDKVAGKFPDGLDPRDVAWIWRRVLVAIGFAHRAGITHGAVLPPHIMIWPRAHGLTLVDWCYAAGGPNPGHLPAAVARYRDWYPPGLGPGYAPGPDLDVYLATKSMLALIAQPVPAPLAAFARGCTLSSPHGRPADAWGLLGELDELIERMWGQRTFRIFPDF